MEDKKFHLAIVDSHTASLILGKKKIIETRFSLRRQAPFGRIRVGDVIFFKKSGGPVVGTAIASRVLFYSDLTSEEIQILKEDYNDLIQAKPDFWKKKEKARYATFVYLENVKEISPNLRIQKSDRRGWVIYDNFPAMV